MKKKLAIIFSVMLAFSLTACGVGNISSDSSASSQQTDSSQAASAASSQLSDKSVDDSLDGLVTFLKANAGVSGDPTTMRADFIGAKEGEKYTYGYNGGKNNVTLEVYEYDLTNLNDTAKQVISQVKSSGQYESMGTQVNAVLSDSGKYLMILNDTSKDDANKAYVESVNELLKGFKS